MEQTDTLKNGNKILQDTDSFMFGIDAVLLAHFAGQEIRSGDTVIDLGTGNGIIPLLLQTNSRSGSITGLEVQEKSAELAKRSVELNGLENKINIVCGDLKNVDSLFAKHSFNVVVSNPPYALLKEGKENPSEPKAIARHEVLCNLDDVVKAAEYLLHSHGSFFMIHRPSRLPQIFTTLAKYSLEPKKMRLVQPFIDEEPNLVLIEARKDARPGLKNLPVLAVRERNKNGKVEYTQEMLRINS